MIITRGLGEYTQNIPSNLTVLSDGLLIELASSEYQVEVTKTDFELILDNTSIEYNFFIIDYEILIDDELNMRLI